MERDKAETSPGPRVSVVIPTYNRQDVLPRALGSVLGQGYVDLEVVVIDDGSRDETSARVAEIGDPRIRYSRFDRNRGIGAARQAGVEASRGDLVAFLDSDDRWKPGKLEEVVRFFDRHPEVDLVFSDYENIDYVQGGTERGFEQATRLLGSLRTVPLEDGWRRIEDGVPETLLEGNFVGTASVVALRRKVFEKAGNFRADLSGPEDLEFWWRAAVLGARFAYTTRVMVERHKDRDGITSRKRAFAPQRMRALEACDETALRVGRPDLLEAVRRARLSTTCDLIEACAQEGLRLEALRAFRSSLRFGVSPDALKYLAVALAGPRLVSLARRLRTRSTSSTGAV
jgi:glycosyltransferase involved in cell wall biosynthesis